MTVFNTYSNVLFGVGTNIALSSTGVSFTGGKTLAQSFSTMAHSTALTSATFFFVGLPGAAITSIRGSILTDNSGTPGTSISSFGNPVSVTFGPDGGTSLGVVLNAPVAASTRYWLLLNSDGGLNSASWALTNQISLALNASAEMRTMPPASCIR